METLTNTVTNMVTRICVETVHLEFFFPTVSYTILAALGKKPRLVSARDCQYKIISAGMQLHWDGDHDWDGKKKNCALRPHILGPTNWCMLFWCMTQHQITGLTPMSCCWQCVFVCAAANWQASCSRGYIDGLLKKQSPTNENADADLIADIPKKLFWWPHTTACRCLGNACCL